MDSEQTTNPYAAPLTAEAILTEAELQGTPSWRREKFRLLLGMVAVFAVAGFVSGFLPDEGSASRSVSLAMGLAFSLLIVRWCAYDRQERGLAPWPHFGLLMVICPGPLIMVPIYLLATRGAPGLISTAKAAVFFVFLIVVFGIAGLPAEFLTNGE